jgi:TetR/AcrR family transcriptional regulator
MTPDELQPVSSPTAVKIVDAAGHLFLQRGYKAVSINDIIRAAEVTKPTLYYYFADKEELFVQMGLRVLAEMGERLRGALATPGGLAERLHAVAAVLMADSTTDMRMMRHEMFEHLGPTQRRRLAMAFFTQLYNPIVALMERGLADGELARYDASTLTQMFLGIAESFQEFAPGSHYGHADAGAGLYAGPTLTPAILVDLFLNGVSG